MRHHRFVTFFALFALAAGCSSAANSYGPGDGGADGATHIVIGGGDDAGSSVKKKDAGKDAKVSEEDDAAVEEDDASVVSSDAGKKDSAVITPVCAPGSLTGFAPSWKTPAPLHQNKCTAANVALAVQCVFDSTANQTTCQTFTQAAANKPCMDCIFTDSTATAPGPITVDATTGVGSINVAACIARLTNDVSATSCAAKLAADVQCSAYACEPNCPGSDQASLDALAQCESDAYAGGCSTYDSAAACADSLVAPGGTAAACADGTTFTDRATKVATLFCAN